MAEFGRILFLPGDGIGVEVMVEVKRVIGWLARRGIDFAVEEDLVGGAAYDVHGVPLAPATLAKAKAIGTIMFGAVGGPRWDNLPFATKPERGLLALRKELDQFDAVVEQGERGRAIHVGASAELENVASSILGVVGVMDGRNRFRLAQDGELLSGWENTSSVIAAPKRAPETPGPTGAAPPDQSHPAA